MVMGGMNNAPLYNMEVIRLFDDGHAIKNCTAKDLKSGMKFPVATVHETTLIVCAGKVVEQHINEPCTENVTHSMDTECYQMVMGSNKWIDMPKLIHGRQNFSMAYLSQIGTMVIGGNKMCEGYRHDVWTGERWDGQKWSTITEYNSTFLHYGVSNDHHCATPLAPNKLLVTGQYRNNVSVMLFIYSR